MQPVTGGVLLPEQLLALPVGPIRDGMAYSNALTHGQTPSDAFIASIIAGHGGGEHGGRQGWFRRFKNWLLKLIGQGNSGHNNQNGSGDNIHDILQLSTSPRSGLGESAHDGSRRWRNLWRKFLHGPKSVPEHPGGHDTHGLN